MSFKGKVVLVTGASSGIGAAAAIDFAREGAKVAIVGRNVEKLGKVANECKKHGTKPLIITADIGHDEEARGIVQKVIDEFGQLDVLVNNAGLIRYGSVLDGNILQAFDTTMNVNVRSYIIITTLAVPHLIKTKGNIINVSSAAGSAIPDKAEKTPYYVSKAALNHLSRCIALELAGHGIRVNIVSPGPVVTDFLVNAGVTSYKIEDMADSAPLKRVSQPKEISDVILFLASDKAVGITGSEYLIDNGYLLR